MIPPQLYWFAVKIVVVVAACAMIYFWGRSDCEDAHRLAEANQQMKVGETIIKISEASNRIVTKYREKAYDQAKYQADVQREIERYAMAHPPENQSCTVSREFERLWDTANGLSASSNSPGGSDGGTAVELSPITVLRAKANETRQCREIEARHHALIEWVKETRQLQKEGAGR